MNISTTYVIGKEFSLFIGRQTAARVLEHCLHSLEHAPPESLVPVSFKNIKYIDFSAADEFIRKLISRITGKEYHSVYIYLTDTSTLLRENIEAALRLNQQVAILWDSPRAPELVGVINHQLKETWDLVNTRKTLTARGLSDALNIPINTSSNRLVKLASLGLIHQADRKGASGGGSEYVYESLTP